MSDENEKIYDINSDDLDKIDLELDDGTMLSCAVIGIFEIDEYPDSEYIALLPDDSDDLLLYRYYEQDDGAFELDNIETEEEFAAVEKSLLEFMDEEIDE